MSLADVRGDVGVGVQDARQPVGGTLRVALDEHGLDLLQILKFRHGLRDARAPQQHPRYPHRQRPAQRHVVRPAQHRYQFPHHVGHIPGAAGLLQTHQLRREAALLQAVRGNAALVQQKIPLPRLKRRQRARDRRQQVRHITGGRPFPAAVIDD